MRKNEQREGLTCWRTSLHVVLSKSGEIEMKDWCNNEGAKRLREKIREYWAERGYEVDVDLRD